MGVQKHPIFTQHSRSWRENRYVYPVISRRSRGLSIGVNLNPDKACNFDCVYCCVDRAVPPATRTVELPVLAEELEQMVGLARSGEIYQQPPFDATPPELRIVRDVAFSGDGEPTACKHFMDACQLAADVLRRFDLPDVKIIVITNATLLHRPAVAEAMEFLDRHNGQIWAKLDAGTEAYYRRVDRSTIPFGRILDNIAAAGIVRPIILQSLFLRIDGKGPDEVEIEAYTRRLAELMGRGCQIQHVQVYTTARRPAESNVSALSDAEVDAIAARVRHLGLPVETYYGPA